MNDLIWADLGGGGTLQKSGYPLLLGSFGSVLMLHPHIVIHTSDSTHMKTLERDMPA